MLAPLATPHRLRRAHQEADWVRFIANEQASERLHDDEVSRQRSQRAG